MSVGGAARAAALLLAGLAPAEAPSRSADDGLDLTDAQRLEARRFVHRGRAERLWGEGCLGAVGEDVREMGLSSKEEEEKEIARRGRELCSGQAQASAGILFGMGQVDEGKVKMASKMYGMVMGLGGLGGLAGKEGTGEAIDAVSAERSANIDGAGGDGGEERGERTDHCRHIAMGTEQVALLQQGISHGRAAEEVRKGDPQHAAYLGMAQVYDSRAGESKSQAWGWGLTASCYAFLMSRGSLDLNTKESWKNYLKLGASSALAYYYMQTRGIHRERARELRRIAESLPKRGDCNPLTDRACFCAEESSRQRPDYDQYCKGAATGSGKDVPSATKVRERRACIDGEAQADPDCSCVLRDDCLDKGYDVVFQGTSLPPGVGEEFARDLRGLARGGGPAAGSAGATGPGRRAADAARFFTDHVAEVPGDRPLTAAERKEMAAVESMGLPSLVARALALHRPSPEERKAARDHASRSARGAARGGGAREALAAAYGRSPAGRRARRKKTKDKFDPLAKLMGRKAKAPPSGRVLDFARRAERVSGVRPREGASLFAILSHRYQVSGLGRIRLVRP